MDSFLLKTAHDIIRQKQRFLFLTSEKIDGDALGSVYALGSALLKLGKEVIFKHEQSIPEAFQFMEGLHALDQKEKDTSYIISLFKEGTEVDEVRYTMEENGKMNIHITTKKGEFTPDALELRGAWGEYDAVFTFDTSDVDYLGKDKDLFLTLQKTLPTVSIDHHSTHTGYAQINIVDTKASSTCELTYLLISTLGEDLVDSTIATFLLLGIIYDTHNFQNANTTATSLTIASELVQKGAKQQDIVRQLYKNKPLGRLKVWGKILSKLQLSQDGKILWSTISHEELKSTAGTEDDARASIDELMTNAHGASLVALLREVEPNTIVISLRSKDNTYDVGKIALQHGGGGHKLASGYTRHLDLKTAEEEVLAELRKISGSIHQSTSTSSTFFSSQQEQHIDETTKYTDSLRMKLLGE